MASGKNCAAEFLEAKGFAVIDADLVAHDALSAKSAQVLKTFEPIAKRQDINLQNADDTINRKALAQIVFANAQNLAMQEEILHPEINARLENFLTQNQDKPCAINATVLYKVPIIHRMDAIIFVTSPTLLRLYRAKKRDLHSLHHLAKRFCAQKNLYAQYQKKNVDIYKVQNLVSKKALYKRIERALAKLGYIF